MNFYLALYFIGLTKLITKKFLKLLKFYEKFLKNIRNLHTFHVALCLFNNLLFPSSNRNLRFFITLKTFTFSKLWVYIKFKCKKKFTYFRRLSNNFSFFFKF